MKSASKRLLFLGCYLLSAFLLAGFLAPALGGDEGVWALFALSYAVTTLVALVAAAFLPLSYCTVLKGVGLAATGSLLVFAFGYAIEFWRDFHA